MNNIKRFLSMFMAVLMCISLLPVSAFADGPADEPADCEHVHEYVFVGATDTVMEHYICSGCGGIFILNELGEYIEVSCEELETEPEAMSEEPPEETELKSEVSGDDENLTESNMIEGSVSPASMRMYEIGIGIVGMYYPDDHSFHVQITASDTVTDGEIYDFDKGDDPNNLDGTRYRPYAEIKDDVTDVIIEEGVKKIGQNAFRGFSKITRIEMPESMIVIGQSAFADCPLLAYVSNSTKTETIAGGAFRNCTGLTYIFIPTSAAIGANAFAGCPELKYLGYTSGNNIHLYVNKGTSLPEGYLSCFPSMEKVVLPPGIHSISSTDFAGLTNLKSIEITGNVTSIPENAFAGCTNLSTLIIPNNVASIGSNAFAGCSKLKSVGPLNGDYNIKCGWTSAVPSGAFSGNSLLESVVLVYNITSIGDDAFKGCTGLTSVTFPGNLTSIGKSAFEGCTGLSEINLPDKLSSIGQYAFKGCTGLQYLEIPGSLGAVGHNAFQSCTGIKTVKMLEGVSEIYPDAFSLCSSLTRVFIPSSMDFIYTSAFDSSPVASVYYGGTSDEWDEIDNRSWEINHAELIYSYMMSGDDSFWTLENGCLTISGSGSMYDFSDEYYPYYSDLYDRPWKSSCDSIVSVVISDGITCIGRESFKGFTNLTSVTIPDSVTKIGKEAFGGCSSLAGITIPENVAEIGINAFSGCTGFTSFTIPSSVSTVDSGTFSGCTGLTSFTIPDTVTRINSNAFSGCTGFTSITIPDSVTYLGSRAFYKCSNLNSVILPSNVTVETSAFEDCGSLFFAGPEDAGYGVQYSWTDAIPEHAFCGWDTLTYVCIPRRITSIGDEAFDFCTGLKYIVYNGTESEWNTLLNNVGRDNAPLLGAEVIFHNSTNKCGEELYWSLDSGGKLTIYGIGAMAGYAEENAPWSGSIAGITSVDLLDGITEIGANAFSGCTEMKSATIPTGVTKIGSGAFENCGALSYIYIPGSVTELGNNAFGGCSSLSYVSIPNRIERIESSTFSGCSALASVALPAGINYIDANAFCGCPLSLVHFDGTAEDWENVICESEEINSADILFGNEGFSCGNSVYWSVKNGRLIIFGSGNMSDYFVDDTLIHMTPAPWFGSRETIDSVSFYGNVTGIGDYAFFGCTSLTSVTIPESVTEIGDSAFKGCTGLASVIIPDSVGLIDINAFNNCTGLKTVGPAGGDYNIQFSWTDSIPKNAFSNSPIVSAVIPDGIAVIGDRAFYGCNDLISVSFPESVTYIGSLAFSYCGFTSVIIPANVTIIPEGAFSGCSKLESVAIIGNKIASIENEAFSGCSALIHFDIPDGITEIKSQTFFGCTNLETVLIPGSVKSIGEYAFYQCDNLRKVYFTGSDEDWLGDDGVLENIADYNDPLVSIAGKVGFLDYSKKCGDYLYWKEENGKLTIFGIGPMYNFEDVPDSDFYYDKQFTSVEILAGVTRIGNYTFAYLEDISSITIPESVSSIGASAFEGCAGLESITIPSSVTNIGSDAFYNCSNLKSAVIPEGVTAISSNMFFGCSSLESVTIPSTVTYIGKDAFSGCRNLDCVTYTGADWTEVSIDDGNEPLEACMTEPFSPAVLPAEIELTQKNILLEAGEEKQLSFNITTEFPVAFASSNEAVATVTDSGLVKGIEKGTAYITASVTFNGITCSDRCRIDVIDGAPDEQIESMQLITTGATANVYQSEDYPRLTVLPVLEQNLTTDSLNAGLSDTESGNTGAAIDSASFVLDTLNGYFTLRVVDDRTLEVIPTIKAVEAALAGSKELKASYTSAIAIKITGSDEAFTTEALKLTVKKTLPSIKADKITFNSCLKDEPCSIVLTGGKVSAIEPDEVAAAKAKKEAVPAWAVLDAGAMSLKLSGTEIPAKYPGSGTVYLKATVEGWAVPVSVKLPFTVKSTGPKLTFSAGSATLLQGSADTAKVTVSAAPVPFNDNERFPITVEKIEVLKGKSYTALANPNELTCVADGSIMTLKAPEASADGKTHTYKITLSCAGREFTYTVKTQATALPVFAAKVTGGINAKIPMSPVTVTVTPKNFHSESEETYTLLRVEQYKGKVLTQENVKDLFNVEQNGNIFTLTANAADSPESGYTYKAVIRADLGGKQTEASAALKISWPKTAPAVTVSAKLSGKLDVTRPDSMVTVTPAFKNLYVHPSTRLEFFRKDGKMTVPVPRNLTPFEYIRVTMNGTAVYEIRMKDGLTAPTEEYSVRYAATASDGSVYYSRTMALPVVKGKVTVKSNVSLLTLCKQDRFSRAEFTLEATDGTVAPIADVKLDAASAAKYQLVSLGNNTWGIEYKDNALPKTFKAGTVKLNVFVEGCDPAAAAVSQKVNFK